MLEPYIGITDFLSEAEVRDMLTVFNQHKQPTSQRRLMVGVMMSYKTLHGIQSKWEEVFPPKETVAEIFCSDDAYNCLHYADYSYDAKLSQSLTRAIAYGGIGIHSLQLDMIWPDPGQVANAVYTSRKHIEVILQINTNALDQVENNPRGLIKRLNDYEGIVQRVLLDKNMGRGLGLDESVLRPFVQELYNHAPNFGVAIAGGLGANSMHLVEGLSRDFPSISIDAQGQLRPSGNALDPIDWNLTAAYLRKALKLFK